MDVIISLVIAVGGLFLYFLPTVIAYKSKHKNAQAIAALNFLTGWTGLGWIIALIWSLSK